MNNRLEFAGRNNFSLPDKKKEYFLLPFNFCRFDKEDYLLVNDLGRYIFLKKDYFYKFVNKNLEINSDIYFDLKSKKFLADNHTSLLKNQFITEYQTKKSFLVNSRKLQIFVVSLRCDHSCPYCQVSRQSEDKEKYDMNEEVAKKSVDLALAHPSDEMTFEFQGGEALLNFDIIQYIVTYTKTRCENLKKKIDFVICTNLSTLTSEHLDFIKNHKIKISTSLDGPEYVHDKNRPFGRKSSYETVVGNLKKAQDTLGKYFVSALMTTTKNSLDYSKEIVDEYIRLGLGSIFLRSLSPYGFAVKTKKAIGYDANDFVKFYIKTLNYIIKINKEGKVFPEAYTSILLKKILTPFPVGYVDLESPAGAGFNVVVYNYDGDVYASDESRMLAEMGDKTFKIGNVILNSYNEIFFGENLQTISKFSCNESLLGCDTCVYQTFCGADPIYHYATQKDMYGNRATSEFCKKNYLIINHLFKIIKENDDDTMRILLSWIYDEDHENLKLNYKKWQQITQLD
jgi:uncharacterized protein